VKTQHNCPKSSEKGPVLQQKKHFQDKFTTKQKSGSQFGRKLIITCESALPFMKQQAIWSLWRPVKVFNSLKSFTDSLSI